MKVHDRRDLIAGAGVAIIGAVYLADTFRIQPTNDPVGPDTLPTIVAVALMVLGVFIAATAFRAKPENDVGASMLAAAGNRAEVSSQPSGAADAETDEVVEPPVRVSRLFVYLGLFAAYAVLLIPLGFIVATTAFLLALTSIYNRSAWVRNILYSVLFSVIIYFAFKEGLGVFLPAGLIG
ncbi:putative tricarboxylic transport membrane protein [Brevibacterium sp. Mu109]|uniref:tripartite tricarboxylate transporter TctB family protein n=1 Tax=Brevibacterium sp. Mu109 TaxID=1255669 RepID=UPI000C5821A3|nr:tripartite tricarboxylate transporter TctB family protein [Brevibacterium sp. Mu109]SMX88597.1 putative tricarboxylic transport membrane protein [Brevibacterium sp. Mu109]